MNALSIASHGRAGKISGISIASFGRIYKDFISQVIEVTIAEIMNLVSRVQTVLNIESRIE